jgi:hypothetical protein
MSIRKAVSWLFDVGDGSEVAALRAAAQSYQRRRDARPGEAAEVHLYGQAEAIRVLYQMTAFEESSPKPPRPRRGRGLWVARYVDSLTSALPDLAAAKA